MKKAKEIKEKNKKKSKTFEAIKRHWKTAAALVCALPFVVYAFIELCFKIKFEIGGAYVPDSLIFFTVGRGLANGIAPYTGLFELKPPGIFLLSGLSFKIFDSPILAHYFQAFVLLLTAAIPVAAFFLLSSYRSVLKLAFAMLAGLMLAIYSEERSGTCWPESFGAAFASLAVLAFAMPNFEKRKILWISIAVIGFLGACGFKEPFLFSLLGASLILCANAKDWVFRFAMPLGIAVLLGIITLLLLGWMDGFLHYFAAMFIRTSGISHGNFPPPPSRFGRALEIDRMFYDLDAFSWGTAIALFVLILWLPFISPFASSKQNEKSWFIRIMLFCAALFLASFSVGLGGDYQNHHHVFSFPFYMALVLLLLKSWNGENPAASKLGLASFVFLAIAMINFPNVTSHVYERDGYFFGYNRREFWDNREKFLDENKRIATRVASLLDSRMDELGIDRYAHVGGFGYDLITARTKHSPEGPYFWYHDSFLKLVPGYTDTLISAIRKSDIIVVEPGVLHTSDWQKFGMSQTCNAVLPYANQIINPRDFEMLNIEGYNIYFRKNRIKKQ